MGYRGSGRLNMISNVKKARMDVLCPFRPLKNTCVRIVSRRGVLWSNSITGTTLNNLS